MGAGRTLLLVLALAACRTSAESPRERNDEINRDLLERLSGTTMQPVEDFDEEGYFDQLEREYADASPEEVLPLEPLPSNPYLDLGGNIWPAASQGLMGG